MSVIPRSLFCNAGNLLLPNAKLILISLIEAYTPPVSIHDESADHIYSMDIQQEESITQDETGVQKFSVPVVVVQGGIARSNILEVSEHLKTHSHEEADTPIPLHILDIYDSGTMKYVDVHCADTDILLLLIDLVANEQHGRMNKIPMVKMGTFKGNSSIDVIERVTALGREREQEV